METFDKFTMIGIFECKIFKKVDNEKILIENYIDENKIVNNGRQSTAQMIAGVAVNKNITKIGFGTSNTTPQLTDTVLIGSYEKLVTSIEYPAVNKIKFVWSLDTGEGNGMNITEYGLICADGSLFARKVRGAIAKDVDLSIEGSWTLIL